MFHKDIYYKSLFLKSDNLLSVDHMQKSRQMDVVVCVPLLFFVAQTDKGFEGSFFPARLRSRTVYLFCSVTYDGTTGGPSRDVRMAHVRCLPTLQ